MKLREVRDGDLEVFFGQQLDPESNWMAAFTRKDPSDRAGFDRHWEKILNSDEVTIRTIVCDGEVAGHVAAYGAADEKELTYWVGKEFWNRGVATEAVRKFLEEFSVRPILARAAADNVGSIRVLEKCGFVRVGVSRFFANARGCEIEEVVMKLE